MQLFTSHCAPDGSAATLPPAKLLVAQLRSALNVLGLDALGVKPVLVARLELAQAAAGVEAMPLAEEAGELPILHTPAAKVLWPPSESSTLLGV